MSQYSRRDFLKLMASLPAGYALSKAVPESMLPALQGAGGKPNIIVLLFDAMSAHHLSLHGYSRRTTPNLERFAGRASVYHAHYSTANFTVPGTSSLLTGLHPWTHRGLHLSGLIRRDLVDHNIFGLLGPEYHRFGFSQNVLATNLLNQFGSDIDELLPSSAFSESALLTSEFFPRDANTAHQVQDHLLFDFVEPPGSLLFGIAQRVYFERLKKFKRDFPRGIPQPRNYPIVYTLENVFNGLMDTFDGLPSPFFSYVHLFSPHAPYRARRDFIGIFDDGWQHIEKPQHIFTEGESYETTEQNRIWYDEYITNVDFEFGRLLDHLESTGVLENSYLIITSDHGELLERGVKGHVTPLLFEPLMRIPLLISAPGQTAGKDIHTPTSSVDLVPTMLSMAGRPIPAWAEGSLLPGLGGTENQEREIYMLEAKSSPAFGELSTASFAIRKGDHKATLYKGYDALDEDRIELYDLKNDPEEMQDLSAGQSSTIRDLKHELTARFDQIRKPGGSV